LGDGFLAIFSRADAAFEALHAFVQESAHEPPDAHLRARAGLHWGDLFVEDKDIYGDVVNTTARLVDLAKVPCVLMSQEFFAQLPPELGIQCTDVGTFEVKGKSKPIGVYARRGSEGEELSLEQGSLWVYRYLPKFEASLRLTQTPLFPPSASALACSRTSYRNTFRRLEASQARSLLEKGEGWMVRELGLGPTPRPCWVYDFDHFKGKVDLLLNAFREWARPCAFKEIAFRLPHRLKALELWVAAETLARMWRSGLPAPPEVPTPRVTWLAFSDLSSEEQRELARAVVRGLQRTPAEAERLCLRFRVSAHMRAALGPLAGGASAREQEPAERTCWLEAAAIRACREPLDLPPPMSGT
jgi:hypothetical protein